MVTINLCELHPNIESWIGLYKVTLEGVLFALEFVLIAIQ